MQVYCIVGTETVKLVAREEELLKWHIYLCYTSLKFRNRNEVIGTSALFSKKGLSFCKNGRKKIELKNVQCRIDSKYHFFYLLATLVSSSMAFLIICWFWSHFCTSFSQWKYERFYFPFRHETVFLVWSGRNNGPVIGFNGRFGFFVFFHSSSPSWFRLVPSSVSWQLTEKTRRPPPTTPLAAASPMTDPPLSSHVRCTFTKSSPSVCLSVCRMFVRLPPASNARTRLPYCPAWFHVLKRTKLFGPPIWTDMKWSQKLRSRKLYLAIIHVCSHTNLSLAQSHDLTQNSTPSWRALSQFLSLKIHGSTNFI